MSDEWYLKDGHGGVVGPITKAAASELLRQRPGVFVFASQDRADWRPVRAPAAAAAFTGPEAVVAKAKREGEQAQRVELELDRFRELPPHLVFGVPEKAPLRQYREHFLALAARYHPGRLPQDAAPALVKSSMEMYQHLTELIDRVRRSRPNEAEEPTHGVLSSGPPMLTPVKGVAAAVSLVTPFRGAPAAAPLVTPSKGLPAAPGTAPSSAGLTREFGLDVLRPRERDGLVETTLHVSRDNAFFFLIHQVLNLKNEGVFFSCTPPLKMGTKLALTFAFREAARAVQVGGAVEVTNDTPTPHLPVRGFGVRLQGLRPMDKGFMLREVQRLSR